MGNVRLDLNERRFQAELFALESADVTAILSTFRKVTAMDWNRVYADRGLRGNQSERKPDQAASVYIQSELVENSAH